MIPPKLDGSMEDWLEHQIRVHAAFFKGKSLLLDVGAYHGDFSRRFVSMPESPFNEAILFEPNRDTFNSLQQQFAGDKRFRFENRACDAKPGSATLFCQGQACTGSLLPYHPDRTQPGAQQIEQTVPVVVLDEFLAENALSKKLALIKIDTQGNDLRVLQGAVKTLASQRPWLVVEMISTPRFVNQARPFQIIQWLEEQNYLLAAQFNESYTAAGWLAWYDACFVPREVVDTKINTHHHRPQAAAAAKAQGAKSNKLWKKVQSAFAK